MQTLQRANGGRNVTNLVMSDLWDCRRSRRYMCVPPSHVFEHLLLVMHVCDGLINRHHLDARVPHLLRQLRRTLPPAESGTRGSLGILHMSDEHGEHPIKEMYALADYVLRDYYHAHRAPTRDHRVTWLPNGPRNGLSQHPLTCEPDEPSRPATPPADQRTTLCMFVGLTQGHSRPLADERRRAMVNAVSESDAIRAMCDIREMDHFAGSLGPAEYAKLLDAAVFTLVPGGNHVETIRLYDAFERGSIPVMLTDEADFARQPGTFYDTGLLTPGGMANPPTPLGLPSQDIPGIVLLRSWDDLPLLQTFSPEQRLSWQTAVTQEWSRLQCAKTGIISQLLFRRSQLGT